jgi:hypothetical protein
MNVSKRSDQVFQLSLTEIAFTITFILLLLLGYVVLRESEAKKQAQEKLAKIQDLSAAQRLFDEASKRLKEGLEGVGRSSSDEVINRLVAEANLAAERDRLVVRVKDLDAQVTALSEIKQLVAETAQKAGQKAHSDRVLTALAMQTEAEQFIRASKEAQTNIVDKPRLGSPSDNSLAAKAKPSSDGPLGSEARKPTSEETRGEVRRALQVTAAIDKELRESGALPLSNSNDAEAVADLVRSAQKLRGLGGTGKGVEAVIKENSDLRGQMANMRNRFSAVGRGLDHPACWADEAGNIEYLFNVDLMRDSIVVTPAWPERRRQDAEKLPGISALTSGPVSAERFRAVSRPILDISKRQDPECRHYVVINNDIDSRREADQARWMVEEFFYKREKRR